MWKKDLPASPLWFRHWCATSAESQLLLAVGANALIGKLRPLAEQL
jgi:hypothetical protein